MSATAQIPTYAWVLTILVPLIFLGGTVVVEIAESSFRRRRFGLNAHLVGFTLTISGLSTNFDGTFAFAVVNAVLLIITIPTYMASSRFEDADARKAKIFSNACLIVGTGLLLVGLYWAVLNFPH